MLVFCPGKLRRWCWHQNLVSLLRNEMNQPMMSKARKSLLIEEHLWADPEISFNFGEMWSPDLYDRLLGILMHVRSISVFGLVYLVLVIHPRPTERSKEKNILFRFRYSKASTRQTLIGQLAVDAWYGNQSPSLARLMYVSLQSDCWGRQLIWYSDKWSMHVRLGAWSWSPDMRRTWLTFG